MSGRVESRGAENVGPATDDRPIEAAAAAPPKVDPETLVLRGAPRHVARFRREIIIGVSAVGAFAIAAVTWIALEPISFNLAASGDEMFEKAPGKPPEALAGIPGRYDEIPKLGPPLPGDLGRPILEHQRQMEGAYPPGVVADDRAAKLQAERERRAAEETAARQSAVLMLIGGGRRSDLPPNGTQRDAARSTTEEETSSARAAFPVPMNAAGSSVSPHRIEAAASPWLISSGSVITASLITGLNSDLPGLVVAQVGENIYDSVTGRTLLIPQGARLIGRYGSDASYGQQRVFLAWQRIIWPDGSSLILDDAPASDASGYAGIRDSVDSHGWQLIKGVALSTLLGVSTELSLGNDESELVRAMRESAQQSGGRAGERLVARSLDIKPTIRVRPGWPVKIIVHKDLVLKPWRA